MSVAVTCSSCATRMKIPEHGLGKRVKCPRCANVFVAEDDDAPVEAELDDEAIAEEPAMVPKRRRAVKEEEPPRPAARSKSRDADEEPPPRRKRREEPVEEADEVEEVEEAQEADEEEDRPRKKKRKKKRRQKTVPDDDEAPAWPWWVFGGGGIAATMLFLLLLAVITKADSPVKWIAIYMLVMMPISTVIFFMAMILSSVLLGAMEIGELHVAIIKAFAVLVVINLVSLLPFGMYLTLFVWLIALIVVFKLDIWEARVLIFFNWVLNLGAYIVLMGAIFSLATAGGGMGGGGFDDDDEGDFAPRRRPPPGMNQNNNPNPGPRGGAWDFDEIIRLGGKVEFDEAGDNILGIGLPGSPLQDADLVHFKEFPGLLRLDLSNTQITDAGLANLKGCKSLQTLTIRNTLVTDAGVKDLQKALPKLRVVR